MKKLFSVALLVVAMLCMNVGLLKADSCLTSTDFCEAYTNLPSFKDGSQELYEYLANDKVPVELRLAVINKLSWDINGKNRANDFWNFLKKKYRCNSGTDVYLKSSGEVMICMAYLKAMDNYFEVEDASLLAVVAESKSPKSFAVHLISGLIRSQVYLHKDMDMWYMVYPVVREAVDKLNEGVYKKDMRDEAVKIIFDYVDMYKDYHQDEDAEPLGGLYNIDYLEGTSWVLPGSTLVFTFKRSVLYEDRTVLNIRSNEDFDFQGACEEEDILGRWSFEFGEPEENMIYYSGTFFLEASSLYDYLTMSFKCPELAKDINKFVTKLFKNDTNMILIPVEKVLP